MISDMYRIDNIENAKRAHYRETGQHLAITLHPNRVNVSITEKPVHPIMLPIAPVAKAKRNRFNIKVKKG